MSRFEPAPPDKATEVLYMGDMTTVARRTTPTEANLLKGMLTAAGIPATVADANLVQADSWLTYAVGGVRVMVPSAFAEKALATIEEYESGAFQLPSDDDEDVRPTPQATNLRLWGPDISAFWSLSLTPVFGATIHYLNSRTLAHRQGVALIWLLASIVVTAAGFYATLSARWELAGAFQASSFVSAVTLVWYALSGRAQSKHVATSFGSRYVKRPLLPIWIAALAFLILVGSLGSLIE